jgi:hypothetical protein
MFHGIAQVPMPAQELIWNAIFSKNAFSVPPFTHSIEFFLVVTSLILTGQYYQAKNLSEDSILWFK